MHRGHHHHPYTDRRPESGDAAPAPGHNLSPRPAAQWQTPHLPPNEPQAPPPAAAADIDLVEAAFVDGFAQARDATSFLRLANIPFEGMDASGARLVLLRVEIEKIADMGTVTPHLGGGSFRYDPLPERMVSRRERLAFVYFDGTHTHALGLAQARALRALA